MSGKNPLGNGKEPQSYEGLNVIVPVGGWQVVRSKRDPTTSDKKYPVATLWINTVLQNIWFQTQPAGIWTQLINSGAALVAVANGGTGDTTLTAHGVLVGEGTSAVAVTTAGTNGQVLTGATGADPAFSSLGTNSGLTVHGVLLGENNSAIVATTAGTTGQVLVGSTGADPAFGALGLNSGLTVHGVLLGENNSAIVATTAGTTGQVLIGSTGADPAFGALGLNSGLTIHGVLLGENNSAIVATSAGATGTVLAGVTGADPTFQAIANLNTVDNTTGTVASPTAMTVNTTYVADQASVTTGFVLPASATVGQEMNIVGNGPGGWQIQQNASQAIKGAGLTTTTGTGGSLSSTNRYDGVTLVCVVGGASTIWAVNDSNGTLTFV